jgi:exportin-1
MAPTIEELDATVRAFYEGRGEAVRTCQLAILTLACNMHLLTRWVYSKRLLKQLLTRYVRLCAQDPLLLRVYAYPSKQFKEDPDAWLLVDKILQEATYPQTKCSSSP